MRLRRQGHQPLQTFLLFQKEQRVKNKQPTLRCQLLRQTMQEIDDAKVVQYSLNMPPLKMIEVRIG